MIASDLTIHILREIRDEIRELRVGQRGTNDRIEGTNARIEALTTESRARFEVIETTLRDLAEQMVMLSSNRGAPLDVDLR